MLLILQFLLFLAILLIYNNNFFILCSFGFIYLSFFLFFKKNNYFSVFCIILYDIFLNPIKLLLFYQLILIYLLINSFKNIKIDIYLFLYFNMILYSIEIYSSILLIIISMIIAVAIQNYNLKRLRKYQ